MKLPNLELLSLAFRLKARDSVCLPAFVGSTLRGAFGTALKRIFCFAPHQDCERCWFVEGCPYQYIFESPNLVPNAVTHKLLRGQKEVPHPMVLVAPDPIPKRDDPSSRSNNINDHFEGNHFAGGETLEFTLILAERAVAFWPQVVVAVRLLAETGLGTALVPFSLVGARAHDSVGKPVTVYSEQSKRIATYDVESVSLRRLVELRLYQLQNPSRVRVKFTAPTRLRVADHVKAVIEPFDLLKKIAERIEFLAFLHTKDRERIDYRPELETFGRPELLSSRLRSFVFEQFSTAQNRRTRREAVLGSIEFEANEEMLTILAVGEILGVRANTSYGFGRFVVEIPECG